MQEAARNYVYGAMFFVIFYFFVFIFLFFIYLFIIRGFNFILDPVRYFYHIIEEFLVYHLKGNIFRKRGTDDAIDITKA